MGYNEQRVQSGQLSQELLDWVVSKYGSVAAFQSKSGLDSDGLLGPGTQKVAEIVRSGRAPVPLQKFLKAVYGDFPYKEASGGRIKIADEWTQQNIVKCKLHTGKTVFLHKLVAEEFPDIFKRACEASGYTPTEVQTWVPRHTMWDPTRSLSMHSWGIAVDFDPIRNRLGGDDKIAGGPSMLRKHPQFIKVFEEAGWTWGGSWKSKDDMHFQRATI